MLVYAHRGGAGEAPENTLGAFRQAWARGARCFELDVRLAADGKLVVIHDARTDRTTGRRGSVASARSAELLALDARRGAPPWPRREGVPTLSAVLKALPRAESWQIELKGGDDAAAADALVDALAREFRGRRNTARIILTSADEPALDSARRRLPGIARGLVALDYDPVPLAAKLGCGYIVANLFTCTPSLRLKAWRRNIALSAWTVNDPVSIRNLHRLRLHSIITDYPSMAVPLTRQLAQPAGGWMRAWKR